MSLRLAALALALSACVQQPPAKSLVTDPGQIEVAPPAPLEKTPLPLSGDVVQTVGQGDVGRRPQLEATSLLTVFPTGASGVSEVRQITVAFELAGVGPENVTAVEFVDPGGAPYHREQPVIEGTVFDRHHLEFVLPVAATAIDSNKLSGAWVARLLVDGRAVATEGFVLTP